MKKYNAAIVGCGRIGSLLEKDSLREKPATHSGALFKNPNINLIAGCDINNERLTLFGNQWNVNYLFTNYKDIIKNLSSKIDILSVATNTNSHYEIVDFFADKGIKLILCEKPIATNLDEAKNMIEKCKRNNTKLLINHERRFASEYRKAKKLILNNEIGELRTIIGNVLTEPPQKNPLKEWSYKNTGGGPMLHDGTHLIDIINYLVPHKLTQVFGMLDKSINNLEIEDTCCGILQYENNIRAFVEGGGRRNFFNFEVDIQGSKGRIIIGNGILKYYKRKESTLYDGFYDLSEEKFPDFIYSNQFDNEIQNIVDFLDSGKEIESTGEDGYNALMIILALYESAFINQPVKIPYFTKTNPLSKFFN